MMYRALLCLALFVGSASAQGRGFSSNKNTECGSFQIKQAGRPTNESMTDVDTRQVLDDLKALDTNKDGSLTSAEMDDRTFGATFDSSLTQNAGVDRCTYVMMGKKRYDIGRGVSGRVFDVVDVNKDLKLSAADKDDAAFKLLDKDGNGKVSVCEAFEGFMAVLQDAEEKAYMQEVKYTDIVYKYRKRSPINFPGSD
ncbi:uncharacterized protein LOC124290051 [Haliotis rubra]|uniref:uncharacterized protein LOC124290051 n=1 Tax=Haliotis rubra TaxID=36100 RepID=UPI001EE53F54|nr:uncharacterized protein LOC124290051 [Haliotis rubra]